MKPGNDAPPSDGPSAADTEKGLSPGGHDRKEMNEMNDEYIISKQRVADHGEVYTPRVIVNVMLDLVKQETERIECAF